VADVASSARGAEFACDASAFGRRKRRRIAMRIYPSVTSTGGWWCYGVGEPSVQGGSQCYSEPPTYLTVAGKSTANGLLGQPIADEGPSATRATFLQRVYRQRDSRRGTEANLKELGKSTVTQRVAKLVTAFENQFNNALNVASWGRLTYEAAPFRTKSRYGARALGPAKLARLALFLVYSELNPFSCRRNPCIPVVSLVPAGQIVRF